MAIAGHLPLQPARRISRLAPLLVPGVALIASLLLGGGTRAGFLADVVLQLIAIPVLLTAIHRWEPYGADDPGARAARATIAIPCVLILILVVQLIPLPPDLWSKLPSRQALLASLELTGAQRSWMPISVAPEATWLALLSLIPAMAILTGTLQLDYQNRKRLVVAVIGFGAASALLGMLQVAQGPDSPLRPFPFTNADSTVGLFANRNHFAVLMCAVLVWLSAILVSGRFPWPATARRSSTSDGEWRGSPAAPLQFCSSSPPSLQHAHAPA